ncbi:hypothetical protein [Mammaliicoccus stepanovicii]|uniref:Uncharacterized protein n=1 Tax=Mammaliicoccus stepanovicii TaxID=643214 RepID=A0A0K2JNF4_9STAP|nr:hypothetical protein [Mammaliicoccus stepanovicii]ALB00609.1 hypothetical protein [Mammaliicoccus stepanovicii]PNZ79372.1 hypothetical protein CD111_00075 [Mammaliicoccus stepanovicii]GGI42975.1 hypothetical protein GCM10010896_21100 [Mammaliicoccus stepanovicii]SNV51701.1 Uncharacterised protein [Mammaliicoccus stepanovicii]
MAKFVLIKFDKILYKKREKKNTLNSFKLPNTYIESIYQQKRVIERYSNIINRISLPKLDIVNIKPILPNPNLFPTLTNMQQSTKVNNVIADTIRDVNKLINDSLNVQINLINRVTSGIDLNKQKETISLLEEQLGTFIEYCEQFKLSMRLEYFSDYYDIYLDKKAITDEDIYIVFKKHYDDIKNNLIENEFYLPKKEYVQRIIENFENKRYTEVAMLTLAIIDYLTIYKAYQEEREPRYKSINMVVNKHILGNEKEINQVITQYTVKLIKCYYSIHNDIEDPDYINRNRLMHGIMDIEFIKKIDCIKLIYLLDVLSSIEIKLLKV